MVAAFALAGCVSAPTPTPSTSAATDAPVFASDEEALAAATEAYAAYLKVSDQISNDGGEGPERIAPLVSDALLPLELEGFAEFQAADAHTVGSTSFEVFKMQSAEYESPELTSISLYICEDVTGVNVVDSTGISLVSPSRKPLTAFQVRLGMEADSSLVLGEREVWKGDSFC